MDGRTHFYVWIMAFPGKASPGMHHWQLVEVELASKADPEMATGIGSECIVWLTEGCTSFFWPKSWSANLFRNPGWTWARCASRRIKAIFVKAYPVRIAARIEIDA
jgi:hypothetical protein